MPYRLTGPIIVLGGQVWHRFKARTLLGLICLLKAIHYLASLRLRANRHTYFDGVERADHS